MCAPLHPLRNSKNAALDNHVQAPHGFWHQSARRGPAGESRLPTVSQTQKDDLNAEDYAAYCNMGGFLL